MIKITFKDNFNHLIVKIDLLNEKISLKIVVYLIFCFNFT